MVEVGVGGWGGVGGAEVGGEEALGVVQGVLVGSAGLRHVVGEVVLVGVGAAGEEGGGDGDADGTSDVAHEVEEAAGVADLLVGERAVGGGVDGHEDEAETEAGDEDGDEERPGRDVERDGAEVERGEAEGDEAEGE